MAEQITIRIKDPADGIQYDVVLDEASRAEITSASPAVTIMKTKITAHAHNTFTADEAEKIAVHAAFLMAAEGLFV